MTGYADVDKAMVILQKDGLTARGQADRTALGDLNTRMSAQVDDYCHRTFTQDGAPTTITRAAPYGPLLPLPDFVLAGLHVVAYGSDVTAACVPVVLALPPAQAEGPPFQGLLYAPANVPTGWIGAHPTSLGAVVITLTRGWPAVPPPVTQAATAGLCRLWRARLNMYQDGGGSTATGTVGTPTPLVDADMKADLAVYVRKAATVIGGP